MKTYRTKEEQLPKTKHDRAILNCIYDYFTEDPFAFEECASRLVEMMDRNYGKFELTQPWRDGGRDAIGKFYIGPEADRIEVDCALEAKCHNPMGSGLGVKVLSRLISRIKYRQFGILVTTSYVSKQAYEEVKDDKHPIVIISGMDLVEICKNHDLDTVEKLDSWLEDQFPISKDPEKFVQKKLI
ncbi:MAG: restriction endonuclease [Candidatus Heimdallarchaeota archaeon]